MTTRILTANRLGDGIVVYLSAEDSWTEILSEASHACGAEDDAQMLAIGARAVASQQVVEPYLIDVTDEGGPFRPLRFREAIRAAGPTIETRGPSPAMKGKRRVPLR